MRVFLSFFVLIILSSVLPLGLPIASAQEHVARNQDEIGLTVGTFIPGKYVSGVKDQIRFWGLSYFHPTSIWDIEYEILGGHGGNVSYYTFTAGPRFDFKLFDSTAIFANIGLAVHHYKRRPFEDQTFSYRTTGGIFLGFGGLLDLSERIRFRAEFKYHNNPGRSLYVGVGPSFVF